MDPKEAPQPTPPVPEVKGPEKPPTRAQAINSLNFALPKFESFVNDPNNTRTPDEQAQQQWELNSIKTALGKVDLKNGVDTFDNTFTNDETGETFSQQEGIPTENLIKFLENEAVALKKSSPEGRKVNKALKDLKAVSKSYDDLHDLSSSIIRGRTKQEADLVSKDTRAKADMDGNWYAAQDTLSTRKEFRLPPDKIKPANADASAPRDVAPVPPVINLGPRTDVTPAPADGTTLPPSEDNSVINLPSPGGGSIDIDHRPVNPNQAVVPVNPPGTLATIDNPDRTVVTVPDANRDVTVKEEPGTLAVPDTAGAPDTAVSSTTSATAVNQKGERVIGIQNRDSDPWKRARDLADALIDKEMRRGNVLDIRNWPRKIGLGLLRPYWKQRLTFEIHETMIQENRSYLGLDMVKSVLTAGDFRRGQGGSKNLVTTNENSAAERQAVNDKLNNMRYQYENGSISGEANQNIKEAQGTLKTAIVRDILRPAIEGRITSEAQIQDALRKFVEANQTDPQVIALFGKDTTLYGKLAEQYATDLLDQANLIKEDIEANKYASDDIESKVQILLANPSWAANTGEQFNNIVDRTVKYFQSHRVLGIAINPATVGMAASLGIYSGQSLATKVGIGVGAVGAAAFLGPLAAPLAAAAIGGAFAAARRGFELKNARRQVLTDTGEYGEKAVANASRRNELEKFNYDSVAGTELQTRLATALAKDLSDGQNSNRQDVINEIADIVTRFEVGQREHMGLIQHSGRFNIEQGELALTRAVVEARKALEAKGMSKQEITTLENEAKGKREEYFTKNKEQQDRKFRNFGVRKSAKAFFYGGGIGLAGGIVGQELMAGIGRGAFGMDLNKTILENAVTNVHEGRMLWDNQPSAEVAGIRIDNARAAAFDNPGNHRLNDDLTLAEDYQTHSERVRSAFTPFESQTGGFDDIRAATFIDNQTGNTIQTSPIFETQKGSFISIGTPDQLDPKVKAFLDQFEARPLEKSTENNWFNIQDDIKDMLTPKPDGSFRADQFVQWHHMMVDVNRPMVDLPDGSKLIHMVYAPEQDGGAISPDRLEFDLAGKLDANGIPHLSLDGKGLSAEQLNILKTELKLNAWAVNSTTVPESVTTESRAVFGEGGAWSEHTTDINRTEFYSYDKPGSQLNELLEKTYKTGSKITLGAEQMGISSQTGLVPPNLDVQETIRNHQMAWNFNIPGHGTIVVPDGVDGNFDGRLTLDPNAEASVTFDTPNGPMALRDFSQLVLNQDAYKDLPDGDIATELNQRFNVWNLGGEGKMGTISAGRLTENNVWQSFATIRGAGEMASTITTESIVPAHEVIDLVPPNATEYVPKPGIPLIPERLPGEVPVPIYVPEKFHPLEPLESPEGPGMIYYAYNETLTPERKAMFERNRSETLKRDPNAVLNPYSEVEQYFNRQSPEYMDEVIDLASQITTPPSPNLQAIITIPVAGHEEEANIYDTLINYTQQQASKDQYEILLFVNHPEGTTLDNTLNEISRFRQNHPDMPIQVMYKRIPKDQAKMAVIRKYLDDAALYRYHQLGEKAGDVILISNDADTKGVVPQYIDNFINKFKGNPKIDALVGQLDWDPASYIEYPAIHAGTRLFQYLNLLLWRGKHGDRPSSGANSAFKGSIYAGVGGYQINDMPGAEDVILGQAIRDARGNSRTIDYGGSRVSRIYTSSRRAIDAWNNGFAPIEQWDRNWGVINDQIRRLKLGEHQTVNYDDPVELEKIKKDLELVIDRTLDYYKDESNNKENELFKRAVGFLGVTYRINPQGKLEITDMSRFIEGVKNYQTTGMELLSRKTGMTKPTTPTSTSGSTTSAPATPPSTAQQVKNAFTGLASGIKEGAQDKLQQYADEILAGGDQNRIFQGLPQGWRDEITKRVQNARASSNPTPGAAAPERQTQIADRLGQINTELQNATGTNRTSLIRERDTLIGERNALNGAPGRVGQPQGPTQAEQRARRTEVEKRITDLMASEGITRTEAIQRIQNSQTTPPPRATETAPVNPNERNLTEKVNNRLNQTPEQALVVLANQQEVTNYIKTLQLPAGSSIRDLNLQINGDTLNTSGAIGTPVGEATFTATFGNDPAGGLKLISHTVNLPFLAQSQKGKVDAVIANLDDSVKGKINSQIDQSWEVRDIKIAGDSLALDFKKK